MDHTEKERSKFYGVAFILFDFDLPSSPVVSVHFCEKELWKVRRKYIAHKKKHNIPCDVHHLGYNVNRPPLYGD